MGHDNSSITITNYFIIHYFNLIILCNNIAYTTQQ